MFEVKVVPNRSIVKHEHWQVDRIWIKRTKYVEYNAKLVVLFWNKDLTCNITIIDTLDMIT